MGKDIALLFCMSMLLASIHKAFCWKRLVFSLELEKSMLEMKDLREKRIGQGYFRIL
ncbi:MAG: hypothetical protein QME12_00890 [Nanoarchaeota archaeon]|nr:hypothetical protein [Nanoarchaeota archaeon]